LRVLILGVNGMLGSAMLKCLAQRPDLDVFGTIRSSESLKFLKEYSCSDNIFKGVDVTNPDTLLEIISSIEPDIVINCVGLIKQLAESDNPLITIPINTILPHRLANICKLANSRLIHFSTDCVYSGSKGNYIESDSSDAYDLYGKSKYLGEVYSENCLTIRTSIIGHELQTCNGLVEWFLSQESSCNGYVNAIFSGLPTIVLSQIVRDVIIDRNDISGLYHISSDPISKYDLLKIISLKYRKKIEIMPSSELRINRSLNNDKFFKATGYKAPPWGELIEKMFAIM